MSGLALGEHVGEDLLEHVSEDALADCGAGLSFIATTVVATRAGEQAIGTLKVGEQVWAYNPTTKKMELKPILHVWISHDNDLVDLTLTHTIKQGKTTKSISEVIHTNKKHPFLTVEKGFLPVGQITLGLHIVEANGQTGIVSGWKVVPGVKTMYNLEVALDHTFVVGVGMWVVHNCEIGRGYNVETIAPKPVKASEATDMWEQFLGEGPYTDTHPRTGLSDPDRLVSADGTRSVRFGSHEMNSSVTKFHFHLETWTYDSANNVMNVDNLLVRVTGR
jgi:Pretoxin HINT domain